MAFTVTLVSSLSRWDVEGKWRRGHAVLKAQYHLLSDVILRLRNNIMTLYFDRYLSCFGDQNSNYFSKFI